MISFKVVMNQSAGLALEIQPLPAYQYFENIRNFLVAVEELNLPSFEASDLERVYNCPVMNIFSFGSLSSKL